MSERKPLTLEELREMYDASECVGIHVLLQVYSVTGVRGLLDHRDDDGICAVYAANGEWLKEKDYGKTWSAYAIEPPRIDHSACEPCNFCEKELDEYPYIVAHSDYDESNTCYIPAFCPICGRPLTDAAWDMLEKRLEGAE